MNMSLRCAAILALAAVVGAASGTSTVALDTNAMWSATSGRFQATGDMLLGEPVATVMDATLVLESRQAIPGPQRLHALVRLPTKTAPTALAIFAVGRTNAADPGFALQLSAVRGRESIAASVTARGQALHDVPALTDKLPWNSPFANTFTYSLRSYTSILPGWPEDYRVRIEDAMARLPDHDGKWLDVRVELAPGLVSFWLDDRLVGIRDYGAIDAAGAARVELSAGLQVAACTFESMAPPSEAYLPLRLGGYANARAFLKDAALQSLPAAGTNVVLAGVPFVYAGVNAEGDDHIAVGQSLFREANSQDYLTSFGQWWAGSALRDPARIQLRIPNGSYDSLYLLAAADGAPDSIPLVSAMFFRPCAGFPETFAQRVPLATARSAETAPREVRLSTGKKAKLWLVKIPLDPGRLSTFGDLDIVEVELTKQVYPYRYYPDPAVYSAHQGGRPSGVHVYAATLRRAPVGFEVVPDRFGHIWTAPETPAYTVTLANHTAADQQGALDIATRSYDGTETTTQKIPIKLPRGQTIRVPVTVPVRLNGYHAITATLAIADRTWTEQRSFVRLAPDTRTATWTKGQGALFGYWDYGIAHHGPKSVLAGELMTRAGARTADCYKMDPQRGVAGSAFVEQHWGRIGGSYFGAPQEWAKQEPVDPVKCRAYQTNGTATIREYYAQIPEKHRPDFVSIFGESVISLRMTSGNFPEYWNGAPYEPTPEEQDSIRMHFNTAKCLAEGFRRDLPNLKILIEWGDILFPIPLLRAGFPTNLIDGTGLDNANFERLPEQQLHQCSLHRMYELKTEFARRGIMNPALYYIEGPFMPTEPGSLTWREQMDIQDRFALLSMAYGITRFYSGWYTFDSADWVGSEHYGGCGVFRRVPYCDPKPAFAAFATMTAVLNAAPYDGWLQTGSLSTYALRFKGPRGYVYTLWTLRGKRPVTLTLAADAPVRVTDMMNNSTVIPSTNRQVTVMTTPSVLYISPAGEMAGVAVGAPDNSDAQPAPGARLAADLGDGSWRFTSQPDATYAHNDFDTFRYPGTFSSAIVRDAERGKVLVSTLKKQDTVHELMPWYNILAPAKPLKLAGAPSHLGLWVRGASDWGRVVYCLRDAKGERWISVGTKDQWNCDDLHSWSAFNFDGWRYLRFEMPGHLGYDNYRKNGTSWWGSYGGDGIVDLPLRLEQVIVEQRSHILYVNDVQPAATNTVAFGKLYLEYAAPEDATAEAVRVSKLRMPLPSGTPDLPNPIKAMDAAGGGAPTAIVKLQPPDWGADGTRVNVLFKEVAGANNYYVWVSAHADGRGAVNLTPAGTHPGATVAGLRPGIRFYFWVVYQDAQGKMSKPSPAYTETLVDLFKEK